MFCIFIVGVIFSIVFLDYYKFINLSDDLAGYAFFGLPVIWNYVMPITFFEVLKSSVNSHKAFGGIILTVFIYFLFVFYLYVRLCMFPQKHISINIPKSNQIFCLKKYLYILISVVYIPLIVLFISTKANAVTNNIFLDYFFIVSNIEIIGLIISIKLKLRAIK